MLLNNSKIFPRIGLDFLIKMDQPLSGLVFFEAWECRVVSDDVPVSEYKNQTNQMNQTRDSNVFRCEYGSKPRSNTVCAVNVDEWEPCTSTNTFDYLNSEPCIFIKLNKVCLLINFYDDSNKGLYDICTNDFSICLISS